MTEKSSPEHRASCVWYLGKDAALANELAPRLAQHNLLLRRHASELELITSPADSSPCPVMILDMREGLVDGQLADFTERLRLRFGTAPKLICIAQGSDIAARLEALRVGVKAVFSVPLVTGELEEKVLELTGVAAAKRHRVLIIDDEQVSALFAARILEKAGMETMTVYDPLKVLNALGSFRPDLLLMDLYMPKASGTELTTLIREHDAFFDIPIVFVSGEKDAQKQVEALSLGGDEFLSKPVDPGHLVSTVRQRIRAVKAARTKQGAATVRDDVTGLFNRRYCLRRIDRRIGEGGKHGPGEALLFIEIDRAGKVQAEMGITATDALVRRVAQVLREQSGPEDVVGRFGDSCFTVIVKRPDRRALDDLAERVRAGVSAVPVNTGGQELRITVSIGVGFFDPPADDALTMISRAEKACAKAAEAGGDRVETWVSVVPGESGAVRDRQLAAMIEESLRLEGFELFYQPILALRRRHAERYETLLRLRAPDGEYIPPFDFLPVAQRHGLMTRIDRWVTVRALEVLDQRRRESSAPTLFVHQTMASAEDEQWSAWLRDEIRDRDLIKCRPTLQFELGDVLEHLELAERRFAELQKLFLTICITHVEDDPAALDAVGRLRIPIVKLSFDTVAQAEVGQLTHLVGRLQGMGSTVIAGGIEDAQTVGRVWSCGVDLIQGNFIQPPGEELNFDFGL